MKRQPLALGNDDRRTRPLGAFVAELLGTAFLLAMLVFGPRVGDRAPRSGRPYGPIAIAVTYIGLAVILFFFLRSLYRSIRRDGIFWRGKVYREKVSLENGNPYWVGPFRLADNERIRVWARVLQSPDELVNLDFDLRRDRASNENPSDAVHRHSVEVAPDAEPRTETTFPFVDGHGDLFLGVTARFSGAGSVQLKFRAGKVLVLGRGHVS